MLQWMRARKHNAMLRARADLTQAHRLQLPGRESDFDAIALLASQLADTLDVEWHQKRMMRLLVAGLTPNNLVTAPMQHCVAAGAPVDTRRASRASRRKNQFRLILIRFLGRSLYPRATKALSVTTSEYIVNTFTIRHNRIPRKVVKHPKCP